MKRTGQYAIIEHIVLIGAGLAIALGFLTAFQSMSDSVEGGARTTEARLVSQIVAASAVDLVQSGSHGKITLDIPRTIANDEYAIKLRDNGVQVVTAGAEHTAPLHGLSSKVEMDGNVISRNQQVSLVYANNELTKGVAQ